jgi:hypothetical protein
MKTATFNDIIFSYDLMQIKTFEFKIVKIYSNVMIIDPGSSQLKTGETMNDLYIESVMIFQKNGNCITS